MKQCWTLERVDMYANDVGDRGDNESESSDEYEYEGWVTGDPALALRGAGGSRWRLLECKLQRILSRNLYLKHAVRDQAFELLRCSRVLLLSRHSDHGQLHSELDLLETLVGQEAPQHPRCIHNCECLPTFRNSHSGMPSSVHVNPHPASNSHFPFTRLPIEIQLNVLSQLAPILSSSQQIRIFEHAVDKTTLPDLSLRLPSSDGGDGIFMSAPSSTSTQPSLASGRTGSFARSGNSTRISVSNGPRYSAQAGGPFGTIIASYIYEGTLTTIMQQQHLI